MICASNSRSFVGSTAFTALRSTGMNAAYDRAMRGLLGARIWL